MYNKTNLKNIKNKGNVGQLLRFKTPLTTINY